MSWMGLEGHDAKVVWFRRLAEQGRLSGSFLFVGPPGIGKFRFAQRLAQCLLCSTTSPTELEACGQCRACQQVAAETHLDFEVIRRPPDRSSLPIELLIGDRDHRMSAGMCHRLSLRPASGLCRVAIIEDADDLGIEAANCLLKILEEPPPRSVLILIGTSELRQLATIRSRCRIVRFQALRPELVAELLRREAHVTDPGLAEELAYLSHGSLQRAIELADPKVAKTARQIWATFAKPLPEWGQLIALVDDEIEAAGKEAIARRMRLSQLVWIVGEFYWWLMRRLAGGEIPRIRGLQEPIDRAAQTWAADLEAAIRSVERCQDAQRQIDANANLSALIDCWLEDLRQIARGRPQRAASR